MSDIVERLHAIGTPIEEEPAAVVAQAAIDEIERLRTNTKTVLLDLKCVQLENKQFLSAIRAHQTETIATRPVSEADRELWAVAFPGEEEP